MSEDSNPENPSPEPTPDGSHLRARIPDHIAGGTFSSGAIVMTGPSEFVIDFLQTIGRPHRVACRVVLPHPVLPQFITALKTNIDLYEKRFGPAPKPLTPPNDGRRPTPQEIYDDLKLPDEVLSGSYSNGVMIGHGANEFSLDFLTSFFPQSAVSARIYLAAGQVPRFLDSLENAAKQLQQRQQQQNIDPSPPFLPSQDDDSSPEDPTDTDKPPQDPPPEDPPAGSGGSGGIWV